MGSETKIEYDKRSTSGNWKTDINTAEALGSLTSAHSNDIADAKIARDLERLGEKVKKTAKKAKKKIGETFDKIEEKITGEEVSHKP
uniref:Uncharacterized protein n=1 Tax=Acrobeloides nanus TaxID=290746 RepID=A0A914ER90_9BILA